MNDRKQIRSSDALRAELAFQFRRLLAGTRYVPTTVMTESRDYGSSRFSDLFLHGSCHVGYDRKRALQAEGLQFPLPQDGAQPCFKLAA